MKTLAFVALLLLATQEQENDAKKELEKLEGTWVMASLEVEGNKVAEERLQGSELIIKDGKYIVTARGTKYEMTMTLDVSKKPKHIDMVFTDGPDKDKLHRGIYDLEGDNFKICRSRDPEFDRPKDFTTSPGTGLFTVVWKKQPK